MNDTELLKTELWRLNRGGEQRGRGADGARGHQASGEQAGREARRAWAGGEGGNFFLFL